MLNIISLAIKMQLQDHALADITIMLLYTNSVREYLNNMYL